MKKGEYFLDCDTIFLYKIPKNRLWIMEKMRLIETPDWEVGELKTKLIEGLKPFLYVEHLTQTL